MVKNNDDTALMAAVAIGDGAAFAILVQRHSPAVYRVGCRMLVNHHDAEEVVQECFSRLWQQAPRFTERGAGVVGWLYRTAMNLCFDRRRRLRLVTSDADLPEAVDDGPLPDESFEAREAHLAVARALADLPERYRAALVLCYYEGLTNAVAAGVLDLNTKAMESLLLRARRQMRNLLEQQPLAARDLLASSRPCAA
jgi:RNA polymerase sigma-70 factor (ECF subfamily)